MTDKNSKGTILIVGASRGLGCAMASEFLNKGWHVIGTVRDVAKRTELHELSEKFPGAVEIEVLDICKQDEIEALRKRLASRSLDILFVNAGTTNNPAELIGEVATEDFIHVMLTNALSPMRVIEAFEQNVGDQGIIGVMSSGQGSIANNTNGKRELYRGSKAALNQFMRSFAARHASSPRAMVLMAPGWVRTALGGESAPLTIEDSVPSLVNVMLSQQGTPGLRYVDYLGRTVPW